MTVRVRIAPAPSGTLHIGNARTALYNWLFARRHGGQFVLRIEDTDQEKVKEEFVQSALADLRWLDLNWDEGPEIDGEFGPYRQSERLEIYGEAASQLLESGIAYKCYCTPEELEERRKQAMAERRPPGYDGRCFQLTGAKRAEYENEGRRWVMRFHVRGKNGSEGEITFQDLITGPVTWRLSEIRDFPIMRQDGFPIYNFGVALDDSLMKITHVIRGMDIQSSTPRQLLVMQALGFQPPQYAHIPLVNGPDGKKLSKRFGGGSVEWYRDHGFLPEALINGLVLLGTGFGDETILGREDMLSQFDLEKVNASAAAFDLKKFDWMNGEYVRRLSDEDFKKAIVPWLHGEGLCDEPQTEDQAKKIDALAPLLKSRIRRLEEAAGYARPVLADASIDKEDLAAVAAQPQVKEQLAKTINLLEALSNWSRDEIETVLRQVQTEMELKPKTAFAPFYVAVTGSRVGAPIFDVMALIGKPECLNRLRSMLDLLAR